MKKHITVAALLIAGTAFANAGTATVSTPAKTDKATPYGFALAIGNGTYLSGTEIFSETSTTEVSLDSVTLLTRQDGSFSDAKIAVFSYVGDRNIGTLVGLSDAASFSTNTEIDFTFTNTTLNVGSIYQYLFVTADTTADMLTDLASYQQKSTTFGLALTNTFSATIPSGWGTYSANNINRWVGQYLPVASITVSSPSIPSIPEPATFGLFAGLGALCLVGTRRFRRPR